MTLIFSLLTNTHIVQVSDRKLTWKRGSRYELCDDETNKAVVWCNRAVFSYTGISKVGQERTDHWIRDAIRPANSLDEALELLVGTCNRAASPVQIDNQRLAIACAG